jgi:DNA-binding response OmpR family regulator/S1-C subfamily serine protease
VEPARERVLILERDSSSRQSLMELAASAGYQVLTGASAEDAMAALRTGELDLLLLDGAFPETLLTEMKGSAATASVRTVVLSAGGPAERGRWLDLGADDVLTRPCDANELLARIRAQLRTRRELAEMAVKTRLAEQGQQIAHTAFQALAVTEKMTHDAFSLDRRLKIGVGIGFGIALAMAAIFLLYSRRAEKETRRAYSVIAQLERGVMKQEDLLVESRRMRAELEQSAPPAQKEELERHSQELQKRIAAGDSGEVADLRKQLDETRTRIRRIEDEGQTAQTIIRQYAPSVCLLHVVVAFRDKESGQRLRYAGINPQGKPLEDSAGNPIFTTSGRGPEVLTDFFGTGFLVAPNRILTNRHVIEPWWKNDELSEVAQQGVEAEISEISAYFPDASRAFRVEIEKISPDQDLAVVQGDLGELKRPILAMDSRKEAAVSGQPLVSMGYATGPAAILARAGEDAVQSIIAATNGSPRQVMAELAKRKLIRPLTTQGHIGDVLPDKIVYDAQTTSGGSGGPLFNRDGKVIGVTFAVVKGFGGLIKRTDR